MVKQLSYNIWKWTIAFSDGSGATGSRRTEREAREAMDEYLREEYPESEEVTRRYATGI